MNYIINPSWFYWISVVNGLEIFFAVLGGLCAVGGLICLCISFDDSCWDKEEEKLWKRRRSVFLVSAIVCFLIAIFTPSKNTLIEMQIARFATYENAEWTAEKIKEAVDYIINAISNAK